MSFADEQELEMLRSTDTRMKRLSESTAAPINIDAGDLRLALDLAFLAGARSVLQYQLEE